MPELPEVETVKRNLNLFLPNKRLKQIRILYPKTLKNQTEKELQGFLEREVFDLVERRAKYLFFRFQKSNFVLVVHLRMTGCFLITKTTETISKHARAIFQFYETEESLIFEDLRTFGRFSFYTDLRQALEKENLISLAPEPAELELEAFQRKLLGANSILKTFLLDQKKAVSGLGNIYVDEALFLSKLLPQRKTNSLNSQDCKRLYRAIQKVIKESIERGGTTVRNYLKPDKSLGEYKTLLNVYGRKNQPCNICQTKISYTKVGQRGTHFCSVCQS